MQTLHSPPFAVLLAAAPLLLAAMALIPANLANRSATLLGKLITGLSGYALGLTAAGCLLLLPRGALLDQSFTVWGPWQVGVRLDALSGVMLLLTGFLGVIVSRFAANYLRGEARCGRFMKWLGATLGCVYALVLASNLGQFTLAWVATSLALHQLLTHYSDRAGAVAAARKKFVVSRTGDACLVASLALTYQLFGTWNFGELFHAVSAGRTLTGELIQYGDPLFTLNCVLLASGAMLKSAQFPFHSWLPDTMETPTPVSALMHAGIINGGGFLVVRLSPVLSHAPIALHALALIGALTAVLASLAMLTQTSIKRSLAFSTIAQMGFMMLQCGLGAFSLAVVHIVAHSLYKAHAFLSSGTLAPQPAKAPAMASGPGPRLLALALSALLCAGTALLLGHRPGHGAGGYVLDGVLVIAVAHLLLPIAGGFGRLTAAAWRSGLSAVAVAGSFYLLHVAAQHLLGAQVPSIEPGIPVWVQLISLLAAYALLNWSRVPAGTGKLPAWRAKLYVHAYNGFYCGDAAYHLLHRIWPAPVGAHHPHIPSTRVQPIPVEMSHEPQYSPSAP